MPSTTRGAFPYPAAADNWKTSIRSSVQALADRVAAVGMLWRQTTAGTRGVAGAVGTLHHSSDTDAVSLDTGSAWLDLRDAVKLGGRAAADYLTNFARAAVFLNQAGITADTDITGLTVTVPVAAGRRVKASVIVHVSCSVALDAYSVRLKRNGLQIAAGEGQAISAGNQQVVAFTVDDYPTAGSYTYKVSLARLGGSGTLTMFATSAVPAVLLVEDLDA